MAHPVSLRSTLERPPASALVISLSALLALAVAMGVGRFAFTPLYPLMMREGLLETRHGASLAAGNYLGYFVGALSASRLRLPPAALVRLGLLSTVLVTAAMGLAHTLPLWWLLRFLAGVTSAWALVAVSAWGLGWLAALGRNALAGTVFSGVGLGIAMCGLFCLALAGRSWPVLKLWIILGGLSALAAAVPVLASLRWPQPIRTIEASADAATARPAPKGEQRTFGLVICYALLGFGYILPATYLPALARGLVDDPRVFGWTWPVFGFAAALSTWAVSAILQRYSRLAIWAWGNGLMALGLLGTAAWMSIASVMLNALLVGATFMVITMVAMQEARERAAAHATRVLGLMTAGFALGQLVGPLVPGLLAHLIGMAQGSDQALRIAMALAAAALIVSAVYLWRSRK